jgi:alpha-D-ribose 1-methylphosphonate 5-triphosphate synthase subunit PhnL
MILLVAKVLEQIVTMIFSRLDSHSSLWPKSPNSGRVRHKSDFTVLREVIIDISILILDRLLPLS